MVTYNRVRFDDSCDDVGGDDGGGDDGGGECGDGGGECGDGGGEYDKLDGKGGDIDGIDIFGDVDTEIEYIIQPKSKHIFTVVKV